MNVSGIFPSSLVLCNYYMSTFLGLTVATVGNIETDQDLLEPIMSHVFKMPVEHFTAYASCLIPFVSTIEDKVYESVEIIFENGYFDRLEVSSLGNLCLLFEIYLCI